MPQGDKYAFPHMRTDGHKDYEPGLSLRDYFAGQAIGYLMASAMEHNERLGRLWPVEMSEIAEKAFILADAMIEARKG